MQMWTESLVKAELGVKEIASTEANDLALVRRILSAYAREGKRRSGEGMWNSIFMQHLQAIDTVLMAQDAEAAARLFRNPATNNLFWGFDHLVSNCSVARMPPEAKEQERCTYARAVLRIAEMLGVVRLFNPEGPSLNTTPDPITPDQVLDAIEKLLAAKLPLPNIYPEETGLATSRGILSYRAIQALYLIVRAHTILGTLKGKRILEIGAGLGRTAYFGVLAGAQRYDIVDIPMTAVSQGYFLGRTLGETAVRLHGETQAKSTNERVQLLTTEEFLNSNQEYDLIANVDSLTEIPPQISCAYLQKIQTSTGVFLSINHEINATTVRQLVEKTCGIIPLRYPNWTRPGYAEEIYCFNRLKEPKGDWWRFLRR